MARKKKQSFWQLHQRFIGGIALAALFAVGTYFLQTGTKDFMASVLDVPQAAPFDGTALPAAEIPDWANLSGSEYQLAASALDAQKFITLPNYDPGVFGTQLASLDWGNSLNSNLVNQLVTYSVPYMGQYKSGSVEYSGSHLGVDVKLPSGTPIHAVANGVVERISQSAPGYGMLVMLRHDDVPLLETNETTTLRSAYAHLSEISVTQGQVVARGEEIGESGNSGTSTGPHLHFQIDNENAPWHPWWPYGSADTNALGVSFSEGVNLGLGQTAAIENTINPMLWVQRYFVASAADAADLAETIRNTTDDTDTSEDAQTETDPVENADEDATSAEDVETADDNTDAKEETTPDTTTETPEADDTPIEEKQSTYTFAISGEDFSRIGDPAELNIIAQDENGETVEEFTLEEALEIEVDGDATLSTTQLTSSDFDRGIARLQAESTEVAAVTIAIADTDSSFDINFIEDVKGIHSFGVELPRQFLVGADQEVTIQALDVDDNPTPSSRIRGTVQLSTSSGFGTFTPNTLTSADFEDGAATVTLRYDAPVEFNVTAQAGAIRGTSDTLLPRVFSDVSTGHAYGTAIAYLKEHEIIGGYDDGTFRPENTVSRVEAMKMILGGLELGETNNPRLNFPDTESAAWYAPFVARAVELGVVAGYPDGTFGPARTVNRAEYLKILTGAADIPGGEPGNTRYNDVAADAWFAPFVVAAEEKNIIPGNDDDLNPSGGMTRGEVAETIYRIIQVRQHGLERYEGS